MVSVKRIGIKYCGGCNPAYERVEMLQRVQSQLKDRFLFPDADQKDTDILVLVNGCPRACADKRLNHPEVPSWSIVEGSGLKNLIDWLVGFDEKGGG